MIQRRIITFSGRVQGVGFRMTAVQFAADLPLAGDVRNLDNGDVELDISGDPAHMDALLTRLSEHFGTFIRTISQHSATPASAARSPGIRITY